MISTGDIHFLEQIEIHCRKCMRAASYFDVASGTKSNLWAFTQNCYGEIAITYWCKVFGTSSEPMHFSKLFGSRKFATKSRVTISIENIRQRLRGASAMEERQYCVFWKNVKDCRNKVFVHNEFTNGHRPTFPDLALLSAICGEMRTIIGDIVGAQQYQNNRGLTTFRKFMEWHSNDAFLQQLTADGKILAEAIGKT